MVPLLAWTGKKNVEQSSIKLLVLPVSETLIAVFRLLAVHTCSCPGSWTELLSWTVFSSTSTNPMGDQFFFLSFESRHEPAHSQLETPVLLSNPVMVQHILNP